jgi:hypothetical protein
MRLRESPPVTAGERAAAIEAKLALVSSYASNKALSAAYPSLEEAFFCGLGDFELWRFHR